MAYRADTVKDVHSKKRAFDHWKLCEIYIYDMKHNLWNIVNLIFLRTCMSLYGCKPNRTCTEEKNYIF